jgi:hypothetical protein
MAAKPVKPASCGTCWYFEPMEDGMVEGECFRYPPTVQFGDGFVIAEAPPVDFDRRPCGEYRPIEGSH